MEDFEGYGVVMVWRGRQNPWKVFFDTIPDIVFMDL